MADPTLNRTKKGKIRFALLLLSAFMLTTQGLNLLEEQVQAVDDTSTNVMPSDTGKFFYLDFRTGDSYG